MPLTRLAVDALGVVTICLVSLLVLLGLFCIIYTLYFQSRTQSSFYIQLSYFNGPWIVRITFILFGIWWGLGEIIRLSLLRQKGKVFGSLGAQWQEGICKYYILSNLGLIEPCMFLTMSFLLRASLQWRGSGILDRRWNLKTLICVVLYAVPILVLDLIFVFLGPKFDESKRRMLRLPHSFTSTTCLLTTSGEPVISVCTYPLLCTIVHGVFAFILTSYILLLGKRVVSSVINRGLRRRVCILIFLVSCFLPLRVILLGFSVMAKADFHVEALAFSGFFVLLSCILVGIFMLVYLPIADSLALSRGLRGSEIGGEEGWGGGRRSRSSAEDSALLIASSNQEPASAGRSVDASTKRSSISFRTMIKGKASTSGIYEEEMTTFSPVSSQDILMLAATSSGPPCWPIQDSGHVVQNVVERKG